MNRKITAILFACWCLCGVAVTPSCFAQSQGRSRGQSYSNSYYYHGFNGPGSYYSRGSDGTPSGVFVYGMRFNRAYVPSYGGGSTFGYIPSYGYEGGYQWYQPYRGDNLYNR